MKGNWKTGWFIVILLLLSVEVGIRIWLQVRENRWEGVATVQFEPPAGVKESDETEYEFRREPERLKGAVERLLTFSRAVSGSFRVLGSASIDTPSLEVYYFEYDGDDSRFNIEVRGHTPEVCMRMAGAKLEESPPDRSIDVDGVQIPVQVRRFSTPGPQGHDSIWTFRFVWVPDSSPAYIKESMHSRMDRVDRLRANLEPHPPGRLMLVGARNFDGLEAAWNTFLTLVVPRLHLAAPTDNGELTFVR